MKHLKQEDFQVSTWSGGKTVQLAIGPEGALYADREFLWRISSATVELESSEFTALPDYERLIAPLKGEMILSHNGGPEIPLAPFEVHRFDGADRTLSRGKCTDFNLMLRKGKVTGDMRACFLKPGETVRFGAEELGDSALVFLAEGSAAVRTSDRETQVSEGEAVLFTSGAGVSGEKSALFQGTGEKNAVLMMAAVRRSA